MHPVPDGVCACSPSCSMLPQVAALIHSAVNAGCAPLAGNDLAAVAEGLKVLLLLSTLMAPKGEAAQVRGGPTGSTACWGQSVTCVMAGAVHRSRFCTALCNWG